MLGARSAKFMSCCYCENPLLYGLLPARVMKSREWREDGPPIVDGNGLPILVGGKPWPSMMQHEVEKWTHSEMHPVTGYNGILCKNHGASTKGRLE